MFGLIENAFQTKIILSISWKNDSLDVNCFLNMGLFNV